MRPGTIFRTEVFQGFLPSEWVKWNNLRPHVYLDESSVFHSVFCLLFLDHMSLLYKSHKCQRRRKEARLMVNVLLLGGQSLSLEREVMRNRSAAADKGFPPSVFSSRASVSIQICCMGELLSEYVSAASCKQLWTNPASYPAEVTQTLHAFAHSCPRKKNWSAWSGSLLFSPRSRRQRGAWPVTPMWTARSWRNRGRLLIWMR